MRLGALTLACLLLLACRRPDSALATWSGSPNHNPRRPLLVVLHHTATPSFESALKTLKTENSGGPVSSHYLLGRDGRLLQLVSEDQRAWHAGGGTWGPHRDLNSLSVGIEIDNDGQEPFPDRQIEVLLALLRDITTRHRIPPRMVVAHADVDPIRKVDPHPGFPWARLAAAGFGLWPSAVLEDPPPGFDPGRALRALGYGWDNPGATVRAFRIHYRGTAEGDLDAEDLRILWDLERQVLR